MWRRKTSMRDSSILLQVCNEDIYRKNVFHILGLPSDVSIKGLRRRREDLDSAHEFGEQSWKHAFPHWLCKSELPSYQQVCEAFAFIEDPANRLVAELFWIWPMEEGDAAIKEFLSGNRGAACESWFASAQAYGRRRVVAQHNLAVVNHALAIEGELSVVSGGWVAQGRVEELWRKGLSCWEDILSDDEFWAQYETRMREFDDPRLTVGFIHRIREELLSGFANVNARLALLHIQKGNEYDAKRQVECMKRMHRGVDDAAQSFDALFAPLETRVERVIDWCRERVNRDASQGVECVWEVLNASSDLVRASQYLLEKSDERRLRLLSNIFEACNGFLVSYGNETKRWDVCLEMTERILPFACTEESRARVVSNQKVLRENIELQEEGRTCAGCGRMDGQKRPSGGIVHVSRQHVKMYGNVRRNCESFGGVSYFTREIDVPCCDECKQLTKAQLLQCKQLAQAVKDGYEIGDAPTKGVMRKVWGLPASEQPLPSRSVGCLVPIVAIGFVVILAGCAFAGCF